ncbi:MAG: c-type cytochrome [Mangrovibacterium sp.]
MKKEMFIAISLILILGASCSSPKKDNQKNTETVQTSNPEPATTTKDTGQATNKNADYGAKLYEDKGCLVCHQLNSKLVGPSIKDIAAAYSGNKEGLTAFLRGKGKAIVDPSQAAVMQPQIAITQALPADKLDAIVNYILAAK